MKTETKSTYELFISYARKDDEPMGGSRIGWVTALRDHILEDHRRFSTEPLRIFFDRSEIKDMDDWRHRILGGLRASKILLICLSPNYKASEYCSWELDEYKRMQVHQCMGGDNIASIYFVEIPETNEQGNAQLLTELLQGNYTDVRPWFPEGSEALRKDDVRKTMAKLGQSIWDRIDRARRADAVPGNLRRMNPYFVGRGEELRLLHEQLTLDSIGLITAVHGLGGQGKTELAVHYAHGYARCYPAGLWVLQAEHKKELLPLIGELAFVPEFGYTPTDEQSGNPVLLGQHVLLELRQRAMVAKDKDPDGGASALLILDNVSESVLLSASQVANLPREDWLRIVATTRLSAQEMDVTGRAIASLAVDSLKEEDALTLIRDHQEPRDRRGRLMRDVPGADQKDFMPQFESDAEEHAAREIVRILDGFTLAVEQVAVYLGLHPEVKPSAYLKGLLEKGLTLADKTGARNDVQEQVLHKDKQFAVILDATLKRLSPAALTALQFASLLPPDGVPKPWLRALTLEKHPELAEFEDFEPDPWIETLRQLEGLRLLTSGDHPALSRIHRLVHAWLQKQDSSEKLSDSLEELTCFVEFRVNALTQEATREKDGWELDVLTDVIPSLLQQGELPIGLVRRISLFSDQVGYHRSLRKVWSLLKTTHPFLVTLYERNPSAQTACDLLASYDRLGIISKSLEGSTVAKVYHERFFKLAKQLFDEDPSAESIHNFALSNLRLGEIALVIEGATVAKQYFKKSNDLFKQLIEINEESNAESIQDIAVSLERLGYCVKSIEGPMAAELYYSESSKLFRSLYDAIPNMKNALNLAVSYTRLGDIAKSLEGSVAAKSYYEQSFELTEKVYEQESSTQNARYHAVSCTELGLIIKVTDGATVARKYHQKANELMRQLYDKEQSVENALLLSTTYQHLGAVVAEIDGPAAAKTYYEKFLELTQELYAAEQSVHNTRGLAISFEKLGSIIETIESPAAAKPYYEKYFKLSKKLYEEDPSEKNTRLHAISYEKLGNIALLTKDLATAKQFYKKNFELIQILYDGVPSDENIRHLAIANEKLGDISEPAIAKTHYARSLELLQQRYNEDTSDENMKDIAIANQKLGFAVEYMDDPAAAKVFYENYFELIQNLYNRQRSVDNTRTLAIAYWRLSGVNSGAQRRDMAAKALALLLRLKEQGCLDAEAVGWIPQIENRAEGRDEGLVQAVSLRDRCRALVLNTLLVMGLAGGVVVCLLNPWLLLLGGPISLISAYLLILGMVVRFNPAFRDRMLTQLNKLNATENGV